MRRLCVAVALGLLGAFPAAAQQQTSLELPPPILTVNQDRLLAETRSGAAALEQFGADADVLAEENAAIEAELIRQERELTQERDSLEPEVFRERADAFDARVRAIRSEQDEKARDLTARREQSRQAFFNEIAGIISNIVREKGALVVLDRRDVFLSADSIDITDEAIRRINEAAGERD